MISADLANLYTRDLNLLVRQLAAFDDNQLWEVRPAVTNSAGNLMLHLNGNLREFIGRLVGGVAYERDRPREFADRDVPRAQMTADLTGLVTLIPEVLAAVPEATWDELYPQNVLGTPLSHRHFVIHLYGHFNYHLGQIDYLRRVLTGAGALPRPTA